MNTHIQKDCQIIHKQLKKLPVLIPFFDKAQNNKIDFSLNIAPVDATISQSYTKIVHKTDIFEKLHFACQKKKKKKTPIK